MATRARYAAERTNLNLLLYILNHPDATCRRAAVALGMSYPNVYRLVAEFLSREIVLEEKLELPAGARGRRARLLRLRSDLGCTLGVEVEATQIRGVALDFSNQLAAIVRRPITPDMRTEQIIEATAELADELRQKAPVQSDRILGVGLGLPGPILDTESGKIHSRFQFGMLSGAFAPAVQERTGLPVSASANSHCFAIGHYRFDSSRESRCLLVLLNRFGLGSAMIWNGNLFRGASEYAGDVGVLRYRSGDAPFTYNELCTGGSLLVSASRTGDTRSLLELVSSDPEADPILARWLSEAVPILAEAIFSSVALYNPDQVMIEGIFSRFPSSIQHKVVALARERLSVLPTVAPMIHFFEGDDLMGARGAALLARDCHAPCYLAKHCTWPLATDRPSDGNA